MFRRRRQRPLGARLRGLVWPRGGWWRVGAYFGHRVRRLPGSPQSIAAGFACGVAVSFTPLVGFHFVLGALLAWAIGGSVLASAIGTTVGNPWTFPFIWFAAYHTGAWLLGIGAPESPPESFTMAAIVDNPQAVLWPMLVGGLPMVLGSWLLSFWLVRRAVARYQHIRRMRIERRRRRKELRSRAAGPPARDDREVPEG